MIEPLEKKRLKAIVSFEEILPIVETCFKTPFFIDKNNIKFKKNQTTVELDSTALTSISKLGF